MINEKRDLRLYYYKNSNLHKANNGIKKKYCFEDMPACRIEIANLKKRSEKNAKLQFVIIEYFDKYNSKIIDVVQ